MQAAAVDAPAAQGKPGAAAAAPAAAAPGALGAEGKADGEAPAARRGGAWWQWLLVVIAMPLLAAVCLVRALQRSCCHPVW